MVLGSALCMTRVFVRTKLYKNIRLKMFKIQDHAKNNNNLINIKGHVFALIPYSIFFERHNASLKVLKRKKLYLTGNDVLALKSIIQQRTKSKQFEAYL